MESEDPKVAVDGGECVPGHAAYGDTAPFPRLSRTYALLCP